MRKSAVKVGLLGLGTVGSGVYSILQTNRESIEQKLGTGLCVKRVLVQDRHKERRVAVDQEQLTTDFAEIINDPEIFIVVEVMGGVNPAREYICRAIQAGKQVVTANKELIAKHGKEIFDLAQEHGVEVFFEASVGGGIPIIRPLKRCLAANRIMEVMGIINGTTNYILTKMTREGKDFAAVLKEAQDLGYAESNPSADVDGYDAAYKILILASAAFNKRVKLSDVYREGISKIAKADIDYARELGYTIKLLGIARDLGGGLDVRVHPVFLPAAHPLAAVDDAYNAIWVSGDAVGNLMFYGRGAGSLPTGSAVVADIIDAARDLGHQVNNDISCTCYAEAAATGITAITAKYYLRLIVQDQAGVLSRITGALGDEDINLSQVIQKKNADGLAEIVLISDQVSEGRMQTALGKIRKMRSVKEVANLIRLAGE